MDLAKKANHPMVNITWHHAMQYCHWLSEQTGVKYRLLTEAEWEYACRAGTTTAFYFGNTITTDQANFNGNDTYNGSEKGQYISTTTPVGKYPANALGLYDMHGNVWEWTGSAYEHNYKGKEQQCVDEKNSVSRVLRGGSWVNDPGRLRSANRFRDWVLVDFRDNNVGFRFAQDLTL